MYGPEPSQIAGSRADGQFVPGAELVRVRAATAEVGGDSDSDDSNSP